MADPPADRVPDLRVEIERLNKIIRALINRAERSTEVQASDFSLFQTALMLDQQVRARTEELQEALRRNEQIYRALRDSEELYRSVVTAMIEGVVLQSAGGTITALNQAAERILGDARESITGRTWASLPWPIVREDGTAFPAELHPANVALRTGEPQSGVVMGLCRTEDVVTWITVNAHPLPPSADDPSGRRSPAETAVVTTFHDISAQKEQAAHFERMASHDTLTGLPNRLLLNDRLKQAIARTQRSATQIAVCYLDLDGFKQVNDRFGHEAGDRLLIEVTRRLLDCVRGSDTVARLGGDEFVLLLADLSGEGECVRVLDRLLTGVAAPFRLDDGQRVEISASIGATLFPKDEADADTLMRHADRAMYEAKRSGGNRYRLFGVS